jgi:hypothetical protein
LGRSAQGALADKELGDEMIRTLRSGAKDVSATSAKDRRHMTKGRVIDTEEVVRLREERNRIDAAKAKKVKNRENRKQAIATAAKPVASSSKHTQKKGTGSKKEPLNLLSDGEETEGEVVEEECHSEGENWEEEVSFVHIDDVLDPEGAAERRIACLDVAERPPVVTRSGRAVKTGHLEK